MKKGETKLKESILPRLRAIEGSWWVKIQQRTIRGIPDILGVVQGQFVAIELKDEAKLDELQKLTLAKIGRAGGFACVLTPDNADILIGQLEKIAMTYATEFSKIKKTKDEILDLLETYPPELTKRIEQKMDALLQSCEEMQEKTPR